MVRFPAVNSCSALATEKLMATQVGESSGLYRLPVRWKDGPVQGVQLQPLCFHQDQRGWLVEVFRQDELDPEHWPAMGYVSQTQPGVRRGPHQHSEQTDVFVFLGPGEFEVVVWDLRAESASWGHRQRFRLGASAPARLIVPPGVAHGYHNISSQPGWVLNFPNRLYRGPGRRQSVDEIRWEILQPEAFPWGKPCP